MSTWLKNEVADAHMRVILSALSQSPDEVEPIHYFIEAMGLIHPLPGWSLLDAGCGAGVYGVICRRRFPGLVYLGTDFSGAMIERAKIINCRGNYAVRQFADNLFSEHDIILLSGILEYVGTWDYLKIVLSSMKNYLILHRIRITDGPSRQFDEETYCGNIEPHYEWNRKNLFDLLGNVTDIAWKDGLQHTLIVRK